MSDNAALIKRIKRLEEALRFYASKQHKRKMLHLADGEGVHPIFNGNYFAFYTAGGIYEWCVENGTVAKLALEAKEEDYD